MSKKNYISKEQLENTREMLSKTHDIIIAKKDEKKKREAILESNNDHAKESFRNDPFKNVNIDDDRINKADALQWFTGVISSVLAAIMLAINAVIHDSPVALLFTWVANIIMFVFIISAIVVIPYYRYQVLKENLYRAGFRRGLNKIHGGILFESNSFEIWTTYKIKDAAIIEYNGENYYLAPSRLSIKIAVNKFRLMLPWYKPNLYTYSLKDGKAQAQTHKILSANLSGYDRRLTYTTQLTSSVGNKGVDKDIFYGTTVIDFASVDIFGKSFYYNDPTRPTKGYLTARKVRITDDVEEIKKIYSRKELKVIKSIMRKDAVKYIKSVK